MFSFHIFSSRKFGDGMDWKTGWLAISCIFERRAPQKEHENTGQFIPLYNVMPAIVTNSLQICSKIFGFFVHDLELPQPTNVTWSSRGGSYRCSWHHGLWQLQTPRGGSLESLAFFGALKILGIGRLERNEVFMSSFFHWNSTKDTVPY